MNPIWLLRSVRFGMLAALAATLLRCESTGERERTMMMGSLLTPYVEKERVPNVDTMQKWPRWTPSVQTVGDRYVNPIPNPWRANIAVDSRNVVHLAGLDVIGGDLSESKVFYLNNEFRTRRGHGLGAATIDLQLGEGSCPNSPALIGQPMDVDIGYDNVNNRAVIVMSVNGKILWRTRDSNGNFSSTTTLCAPADWNVLEVELAVDSGGTAHVAAICQKIIDDFTREHMVAYSSNFAALGEITGTRVDGIANPLSIVRIRLDPGNAPHLCWIKGDTQTNNPSLLYSLSTGGVVTIANGKRGDLHPETSTKIHFAYARNGTIYYRNRDSGVLSTEEKVSGVTAEAPRIFVDSRGQPVVVYTGGQDFLSVGVSYAARINHAGLTYDPAQPWPARQEPIPDVALTVSTPFAEPVDIAFDKNDTLYMTHGENTWTRTYDPNLGAQDGFVTFPGGPNTSVSTANGNVTTTIPIFGSRGVGFSTNLSLVYNSLEPYPGMMSQGWRHNYQITVTDGFFGETGGQIQIEFGDGRAAVFNYDTGLGYWVAADEYGEFSKVEVLTATQQYRLTTKFGVVYTFNVEGKLTEIKDTNNNTLGISYFGGLPTVIDDSASRQNTTLAYDPSNRLSQIIDPANKSYTFGYDATTGRLNRVTFTGETGVEWECEYYAQDNLAQLEKARLLKILRTPRGKTGGYGWSFKYQLDNRVREIHDPSESSVTSETDANAQPSATVAVRLFDYNNPAPPFPAPTEANMAGETVVKARFTDRRGFQTEVLHEQARSLAHIVRDHLNINNLGGVGPIVRTFDGFRNVLSFKDKRANTTTYTYHTTGVQPPHVKDNLKEIFRPGVTNPISLTYSTDNLNRVKTVTDSKTNTTTFDYDAAGNLTRTVFPQVTQSDGSIQSAEMHFCYDSQGRPSGITAPEGGVTQLSYNDFATGLVSEILHPAGTKTERFAYNTIGTTSSHTLPEGGVTDMAYDGLHRMTSVTDPPSDAGRSSSSVEYNADSMAAAITLPTSSGGTDKTRRVYDKLGRVIEIIQNEGGPLAASMLIHYDREGNVRRRKDFRGNTVYQSLYDELGRLSEAQQNVGTTVGVPTDKFTRTLYSYDPNGNVLSVIQKADPPGSDRLTTMAYNARNLLDTTTNPDTTVDTSVYDANDNLIKSFRKFGTTFLFGQQSEFDQRDRPKWTELLQTETVAVFRQPVLYNRDSDRTEVKDALNRFTRSTFDLRNRLTSGKNGLDIQQFSNTFDDNDRRTALKVVDPNKGSGMLTTATFEYNPKNELKKLFDANGVIQGSAVYDKAGNVTEFTNTEGTVTRYEYDALNRMTKKTEDSGPLGSLNLTTQYQYDANGNLTQITDPREKIYKYFYNKANQLEKLEYPQIGVNPVNKETWTYNEFGQLASHTDANNKTATYSYDTSGRLTTEVHGAPFSVTITRTYTNDSNLDTITDGTLTIDYGYDVFQRLTSARWTLAAGGFDKTVNYAYYDNHLLNTVTDPEGQIVTYEYDNDNRLFRAKRQKGGPIVTVAEYGYDDGGRRKSILFGNGVTEHFTRDKKGQITQLRFVRTDNTLVSSVKYTYNDLGNRTEVEYEHLDVKAKFGYNRVQWLASEVWSPCRATQAGGAPLAPGDGNVSANSSVATVVPQVPETIPAHYQFYKYDEAGNRLDLNGIARTATYTYDEENRLTQETPGTTTKVPIASTTATASDTESGFTAARINDGETTDQADSAKAWKSQNTAVQHWAQISWSGAKNIRQVRLFIPTSPGAPTKFKVQYDAAGTPTNPTVLGIIGAEETSPGSGWYTSACHEVVFAIEEVSTTAVRFLQDVGGGAPGSPNVAWLNELEAHEKVPNPNPINYCYDANGNQKLRHQFNGTNQNIEEFGFDYVNRQSLYKKGTGTVSSCVPTFATTTTHFAYTISPTGDRFSKKDVLNPGTNPEERYMYSGRDVVADYTLSGTTLTHKRSYVQTQDVDTKIARFDADETAHYYVGDALNSVNYVVSSTGVIQNTTITNSWGEHLVDDQSGVSDRHGFAQRERDDESSTMHLRARPYDPRTGRFLGKDPILSRKALSHYLYASNNPVMRTDPFGEQDETELPKRVQVAWEYSGGWFPTLGDEQMDALIKEYGIERLEAWKFKRVMTAAEYQKEVDDAIRALEKLERRPERERVVIKFEPGRELSPDEQTTLDWIMGGFDFYGPGIIANVFIKQFLQKESVTKADVAGAGLAIFGAVFVQKLLNLRKAKNIGGRITEKLEEQTAKRYREEARMVWDEAAKITGGSSRSGLHVHHRIPLEWSHKLPEANPNRLANLIGLDPKVHDRISKSWAAFKKRFADLGTEPNAADIMKHAELIDDWFGKFYVYPIP